ncbi:MAG: hypothetical protein LBI63_02365 [Candidatus Ancillula sp.]|jgi:hypothetical protein|nr:hypothetical protein [Candidatus Ancillula sp.]
MNLKKTFRGMLAIGVAFAIVTVPNTVKFANAKGVSCDESACAKVEVNDSLAFSNTGQYNYNRHYSELFGTEDSDGNGTRTTVQVTITNNANTDVLFNVWEDIGSDNGDDWFWNGSSFGSTWDDHDSWSISKAYDLAPNVTATFPVTTNTQQAGDQVRGVYVRIEDGTDYYPTQGTVDVNMKKIN